MYSSRMRTVRCSGRLWGGRCPGSCVQGGVSWVCVCVQGGVSGGCVQRGGNTSALWTEFLTHACENITFPQLLLRTVTNSCNWFPYSSFGHIISSFLDPPLIPSTTLYDNRPLSSPLQIYFYFCLTNDCNYNPLYTIRKETMNVEESTLFYTNSNNATSLGNHIQWQITIACGNFLKRLKGARYLLVFLHCFDFRCLANYFVFVN